MDDLFTGAETDATTMDAAAPLASRMRPRSLEEFVGQEHILAPGKLLRRAIEADRLPSVILSGPPGTGKTTLAQIIAAMTKAKFERLSGVESNVAEMRKVVAAATQRRRISDQKTILFVDEIHHFNKGQQDILLPDVESGNLRLIGATTYNPFFYVNSALVSRSQVFQLESLGVEELEQLIDRALADKERGLGNYRVQLDPNAKRHLAKLSDGDARKCLNALEIGVLTTAPNDKGIILFALPVAEESIQTKAVVYDRVGDAHYDTISAFIKSMRASDEKERDLLARQDATCGGGFSLHRASHRHFRERRRRPGRCPGAAACDRDPAGGRVCRHAGSAHSPRPCDRLHVPRQKKSRSLRIVRRSDRGDRGGENEARATEVEEQTLPG